MQKISCNTYENISFNLLKIIMMENLESNNTTFPWSCFWGRDLLVGICF